MTKKQMGFTMVEMVVITLIVGIITSIAIPSWTAFLENQRLNSSQIKLFNAVASAKSIAKKDKRNVKLIVSETNVSIDGREEPFEEGITGVPAEISFNFQGNPDKEKIGDSGFFLTVNSRNQKACVAIMTLIGSVRSFREGQCR